MKKSLKMFFVLAIMLIFSMNLSVFATNTENTIDDSSVMLAATSSNSSSNSDSSSTTVGSVPLDNEGELSISDILNILLIATGVVIILLAIAIFIKLK